MQTSTRAIGAMGVLTLLLAIGVGAWIYQLVNGLGVTGMSNANSWGLYIACFMFFVGLSAGGLIVASSASVFKIAQYKKVAVPAVILSTVCICCAGLFILIDLGGIARVWRMLTGPNFLSPLVWDLCVISCYLVINLLDLYWMSRGDERKVEMLSRVALPVAILVHSVTAWIFGLQIARAWYSAIMAPIFVASAMDSGLALLIIALVALNAAKVFETSPKLIKSLAGLLAVFVAVDAFFVGCEVLTMAYPGAGESLALAEMLGGAAAPFFWIEIVLGLVVPFCVLALDKLRANTGAVVAASCLIVLGVLCKRVWLLLTSFVNHNVSGAPGISLGTNAAVHTPSPDMWTLIGSYAPTPIEVIIVLGVLSGGVLAFVVLSKKFLKGEKKTLETTSHVVGTA